MALQSLTGRMFDEDAGDMAVMYLSQILQRLGYPDQTQGSMRVTTMTGSIITTVTTVATVSSLTNMANIGGIPANNDQYVQGYLAYGQNRSRITVV